MPLLPSHPAVLPGPTSSMLWAELLPPSPKAGVAMLQCDETAPKACPRLSQHQRGRESSINACLKGNGCAAWLRVQLQTAGYQVPLGRVRQPQAHICAELYLSALHLQVNPPLLFEEYLVNGLLRKFPNVISCLRVSLENPRTEVQNPALYPTSCMFEKRGLGSTEGRGWRGEILN